MKKIASYILVFVLIITFIPIGMFSFEVAAETDGYYTYKVNGNEVTITSVSSNISGDVIIPSTLGGYPVTCIGKNAFFYKSKIGSVVIPNTVTTIESYAFNSSSITSVTIPNSVTSIGSYAFDSCYGLTSVTIPDSINALSNGLFYQCKNLKTVVLPLSVTTIDIYAFYGCGSLTDVWYEGTEQQKNAIEVTYSYYNPGLENATWHYNSCPSNGTHKYDNNCDTDCNLCGVKRSVTHSYQYNSWVVTKEPTCVATGSRYQICTVCQYVFTETVPALGHNKITHSAKVPTCTEIGWDEYVTCSRCDYTTYKEIAATNEHNYVGVITEPTCTTGGYTTYTCSMCDDSYVDNYVNENGHSFDNDCDTICNNCDFTRETSHEYSEWITTKDVSCTEDGSKYKECSRCGDVIVETITAVGSHDYTGATTLPTCTAEGFTTYTCSVCGDSYIDNYVDATGHTYDDDFDAFCNECNAERNAKKYGDINNDDVLNGRDAALLMQYINNWNVMVDLDAADINHDGKINNKDYVYLMRKINGWENY